MLWPAVGLFSFLVFQVVLFTTTYKVGSMDGKNLAIAETRYQVVVYCNEKPKLCKEEYEQIKLREKVGEYKKPELEEVKWILQ